MIPSYVVITPVRDEERWVRLTIESMLSQTLPPAQWVLVDDGSTDRTGEIIDGYAGKAPWIRVLHVPDRGFRAAGGGVVEAFYAGYRELTTDGWDLIVKLDGDLSFGPDYFERCLAKFDEDHELGIAGGILESVTKKGLVREKHPMFHVRGATKIYRRACWDEIGGLIEAPGWDTVDEVKANMLGWKTRSFPDVLATQHKPSGAAAGQWRNWVKLGEACYISGYHPLFLVARSLVRLRYSPYLVAAAGLLWGFIRPSRRHLPRIQDQELISYLQRQQLRRLFGRTTIWR